jgi:galactokinase
MLEDLKQQFLQEFGHPCRNIFFAPGRVNLIGEHIDYNGGLVMPCAVTFGTYLLVAPNNDGLFRFRSTNFDERADIPVQTGYVKSGSEWFNYPLGVIHNFVSDGKSLTGLDMLFFGNLPIGSGLSSSASIEVATAFALNTLFGSGYTRLELVLLSKRVENEFIGLNSGIMDQFAVAFGEQDKALKLDCETLDYEAVDCNLGEYSLAIINTNKPRKLAESKYNERFDECRQALGLLQQELNISNLCEISPETFAQHQHLIADETLLKRATHVIEEHDRVQRAALALAANNLEEFGRLMYASHESLKNLYEVSGDELDAIVEFSAGYSGVAGARMTGAGFGGCAIAILKTDQFRDYQEKVSAFYTAKVGYEPSVYLSDIGTGVCELTD